MTIKRALLLLIALGQLNLGHAQNKQTQWNGWKDSKSVKKLLLQSREQDLSYFSQFHIYDVRGKNIYSSCYKQQTNEIPYIYGLDFYYASGTYFSKEYKSLLRSNIVEVVKREWRDNRAIPCFSWHLENPYVPSSFNDYMGCHYCIGIEEGYYPIEHQYVIHEILTGKGGGICGYGQLNGNDNDVTYKNPRVWFEARCKEVASIINEFVDDNGKPIPFIFRLWHECEDSWMWWGSKSVSIDDYKRFFVYTEKRIKRYAPKAQIIWGYCPDSNWRTEEEFMLRYPGDKYVDIIGYDDYKLGAPNKLQKEIDKARIVTRLSEIHGKSAAIFETANKDSTTADVFYQNYLSPMLTDPDVRVSLVQVWCSGRFENVSQYNDRIWFLQQPYILKIED